MKKYRCHFTNKEGSNLYGKLELINAESAEAAAKLFFNGKSRLGYKYILVTWGDGKSKIFTTKFIGDVNAIEENIHQELDINLVVEHLQLSNKILGRIQALQERQINEIKSVQWWMRFGIFMILLQIITAKIKLGL